MIDPVSEPPHRTESLFAGIVLAAGRGARFAASVPAVTTPKPLALFRGRPLILHACRALLDAGVQQAIVVVGYCGEVIARAIDGLESRDGRSIEIVDNPAWKNGLSTSVRAGLARVAPDLAGVLLMPADQPLLEARHLRLLIAAQRASGKPIVTTTDDAGRVRGAPALFARSVFPRLAALEGDHGARDLLRRSGQDVATVGLGARSLLDIDTIGDLEIATAAAAERPHRAGG